MTRHVCLTRKCLGVDTRIELIARPVAAHPEHWIVLCAAGLAGKQPTAIKVEGPFADGEQAEQMLTTMGDNILFQGYACCDGEPIWRLHLYAEWRYLNRQAARAYDGRGVRR